MKRFVLWTKPSLLLCQIHVSEIWCLSLEHLLSTCACFHILKLKAMTWWHYCGYPNVTNLNVSFFFFFTDQKELHLKMVNINMHFLKCIISCHSRHVYYAVFCIYAFCCCFRYIQIDSRIHRRIPKQTTHS